MILLEPHQIYGLMFLANMTVFIILLALRYTWPHMKETGQKVMFVLGMAALIGLPAISGLSALDMFN